MPNCCGIVPNYCGTEQYDILFMSVPCFYSATSTNIVMLFGPAPPSRFLQSWHRSQPNALLVDHKDRFLDRNAPNKPSGAANNHRVLVPLCGKTVDMTFLSDQGQKPVLLCCLIFVLYHRVASENSNYSVNSALVVSKGFAWAINWFLGLVPVALICVAGRCVCNSLRGPQLAKKWLLPV